MGLHSKSMLIARSAQFTSVQQSVPCGTCCYVWQPHAYISSCRHTKGRFVYFDFAEDDRDDTGAVSRSIITPMIGSILIE
jgi:hypothetical protein